VLPLFLLALLLPQTAFAQWANYPTPNLPRGADGKLDINAPAPRTADGKPDLAGLWEHAGPSYMQGAEIPYRDWAANVVKERTEDGGKDDPTAKCLPWGQPRLQAFSVQKIVQTPGLIIFLYEYLTTFRQVFTDGRTLPADANPTWMGYSVGRWEGDTLIVETGGFNGKSWLEVHGQPVTEEMHVTERIRRPDFGHPDSNVVR
jgi:hypothetical protein